MNNIQLWQFSLFNWIMFPGLCVLCGVRACMLCVYVVCAWKREIMRIRYKATFFIYLSICLSIYKSIYLSMYLSIYPFIYLSIYLSIHQCTWPCPRRPGLRPGGDSRRPRRRLRPPHRGTPQNSNLTILYLHISYNYKLYYMRLKTFF